MALDPGLQDLGLAKLQDSVLVGAWWIRSPVEPARCARCARAGVVKACAHVTEPLIRAATVTEVMLQAGPLDEVGLLVMEWPIVYQQQKAPSDDLLAMCGVAGGVHVVVSLLAQVPCLQVRPSEWKGRQSKDVFQTIILACLEPHELALIPRGPQSRYYLSDPVDAVGLALWSVGRLGKFHGRPSDFTGLVEPVKPKKRPIDPLFPRRKK